MLYPRYVHGVSLFVLLSPDIQASPFPVSLEQWIIRTHRPRFLCFSDYNALFYSQENRQRFPTGTCFPFSKKMFVTVKGKIMTCERIGQSYALGHMDAKGVSLDFQKIADNYNRWFDQMKKQCSACYHLDQCTQCIFYLDLSGKKPVCRSLMNADDYSRYLSSFLGYFEHNRYLYNKILKEVVIE